MSNEIDLTEKELLGWMKCARENGYLAGVIPYGNDRFEQGYIQIVALIKSGNE